MPPDLEPISLIEPMLPAEGTRVLEDLATELIAKSHSLQAVVNQALSRTLAELVRSMNCYYSNLIEGHHTHPRDIDRALANDFSTEPKQRALQLEAKAHIEVQRLIDSQSSPVNVISADYLCWIHRQFCQRLPAEFLVLENPQTGKQIQLQPGEFRTGGVKVGAHIPISAPAIPLFLQRFEQAYNPKQFSKVRQVIAIAASHHGLLSRVLPFWQATLQGAGSKRSVSKI
jgi:Fic family protein